jgi:tetratricopeptide (TPR) repeat protein
MQIREASLDMEIGRYDDAKRVLDHLPPRKPFDLARDTIETRYAELTGHLTEARRMFERPTALQNSQFDAPAQTRAWFFFRSGELAFEAGDNDAAIADEQQATQIFPGYADALRAQARFECALHRWNDCLTHATASANVVPYPETLGYEADAQRALGDAAGAARTDDLIRTIERIGNTQHISDRLLAIYYSEHRIHTADAYAIAKRELAVRDDIFTEDTLAWAAAMDGRWAEARVASAKALRFDTENSLLQYHAGAIADHFGDATQAKRYYKKALALNSQFHQVYADDARARLAALGA